MTENTTLLDYLIREKIPHSMDAESGRLTVQDNLTLIDGGSVVLPEHLTVLGSFGISGRMVHSLPENLSVRNNLLVHRTSISSLPQNLSVGGDIALSVCKISHLPENFRVRGSLDLYVNPIESLPEGLDVDGELNLHGTYIQRFPASMRVGKTITPPSELLDILLFMKSLPDEVVLSCHGTGHQTLMLRDRLRAFPDLTRVVESLGPDQQLRICRDQNGETAGYYVEVLKIDD